MAQYLIFHSIQITNGCSVKQWTTETKIVIRSPFSLSAIHISHIFTLSLCYFMKYFPCTKALIFTIGVVLISFSAKLTAAAYQSILLTKLMSKDVIPDFTEDTTHDGFPLPLNNTALCIERCSVATIHHFCSRIRFINIFLRSSQIINWLKPSFWYRSKYSFHSKKWLPRYTLPNRMHSPYGRCF